MAAQASFDITSKVDLQEVDNAINQAKKELAQRYDFKGSKSTIELKAKENLIELVADDNFKMEAVWEIVLTRLIRRGVPTKNLKPGDIEPIGGALVKRKVELQQGINSDAAREITKFVKEQKLKKIQVTIQGDQLRVTSPSKDELQNAIQVLRAQDFGVELQFGNFRDWDGYSPEDRLLARRRAAGLTTGCWPDDWLLARRRAASAKRAAGPRQSPLPGAR